jgi:hypothetical protein
MDGKNKRERENDSVSVSPVSSVSAIFPILLLYRNFSLSIPKMEISWDTEDTEDTEHAKLNFHRKRSFRRERNRGRRVVNDS